jgi:prepilin-type processing-associated H-X9-DG protein
VHIWPYIEEQLLFDRYDHTKANHQPNNGLLFGVPLNWLVCPSDDDLPSTEGVFAAGQNCDGGTCFANPKDFPVMGLWYPVSAGPTHFDACPYCDEVPSMCCQGKSFGSRMIDQPGDPLGPPNTRAPTFAGMFGRYEIGIKLAEVTDGLTHTIMGGETLNKHCRYMCAHCPNFPISTTSIPLNTFRRFPESQTNPGVAVMPGNNPELGGYAQACGYKSRHPGGAHLLMGDGSVQFANEAIDFEIYYLLGARKSGELKQLQ